MTSCLLHLSLIFFLLACALVFSALLTLFLILWKFFWNKRHYCEIKYFSVVSKFITISPFKKYLKKGPLTWVLSAEIRTDFFLMKWWNRLYCFEKTKITYIRFKPKAFREKEKVEIPIKRVIDWSTRLVLSPCIEKSKRHKKRLQNYNLVTCNAGTKNYVHHSLSILKEFEVKSTSLPMSVHCCTCSATSFHQNGFHNQPEFVEEMQDQALFGVCMSPSN